MTYKITFLNDMNAILRSDMEEIGVETSSLLDEDVMAAYFTLSHRLIKRRKRRVHKPVGFSCPISYEAGLKQLEERFEKGLDVNPYQSKKIGKTGGLDLLFFDWNIHHFHLGETVEVSSKNFIQRTSELLFAMVCEDDVYFISVKPHGGWSDKELLEVLHDNWPEIISNWKLQGTLSANFTSQEIGKLRKCHVNTAVQLKDNTTYMIPGGGYMADGTMTFAMMERNKLVRTLSDFDSFLRSTYPSAEFTLKREGETIKAICETAGIEEDALVFPNLKQVFGSFMV